MQPLKRTVQLLVALTCVGGVLVASPSPAGAGSLAVSIAAGRDHTCAMTTRGGAKCWGYNYFGELGIGVRSSDESIPLDVSGLHSGVATIGAGYDHSCALTIGGGVQCWGDNDAGQVGAAKASVKLAPFAVPGLASGVAQLSVGFDHTCVVTDAGGAKCWGLNTWGALGNGTVDTGPVVVDVSGLTSGVAQVSAGSNYSCALTTLGGAKCWGNNATGQLGDGTTDDSTTPVDVSGLTSGVAAIASAPMGYHACAIMTGGTVKCWGTNYYGELGDGTTTNSLIPVDVQGLPSAVTSLVLGAYHTCALTDAGAMRCWGANDFGQLGNGTLDPSPAPVDVSGLTTGVVAIAAGTDYTCAVTDAGVARCWGHNHHGQVGDSTMKNRRFPAVVAALPGVPKIYTVSPGSGPVGTGITIVGFDLKHASSVTFHSVQAHFTIVSNTKITTKVPAGAVTGPVRVTTPGGTATNLTRFKVT